MCLPWSVYLARPISCRCLPRFHFLVLSLSLRRAPSSASLLSCGRYDELFMNSTQEQVESTTLERPGTGGASSGERCPRYISKPIHLIELAREKKGINILGRAPAKRNTPSRSRDDIVAIAIYYKWRRIAREMPLFKLHVEYFVTYVRKLHSKLQRVEGVNKLRY